LAEGSTAQPMLAVMSFAPRPHSEGLHGRLVCTSTESQSAHLPSGLPLHTLLYSPNILDLSVRQHCLCCPAVAQALLDLADVLSRAMFVYSTGCVLADLASVSRDFLIC